MKRMGLIIGNPGELGASNFCKGVEKDLQNYSTFLTSALGGAWYGSEIKILRRPSTGEAKAAIHALKVADYSFAVFCGHGHTDKATKSLVMELRAGQYLGESDMREGAVRHTTVFDCCRVISPSILTEERLMKALATRAIQSASSSRVAFDSFLQATPKGLVVAFACGLDEAAGDDERSGGYYSSSLFQAAESWSDQTSTGYQAKCLTVVDAHVRAEVAVRSKSGSRQNPVIEKPRSVPYFPFAVIA